VNPVVSVILSSLGYYVANLSYPLAFYIVGFFMKRRANVGYNRKVEWKAELQIVRERKQDQPNVILIIADDLGNNKDCILMSNL